ncbi:MAG TPA: YbaK/EbsC family protein [Candidatus Limnocylindria bacterium]|nr:YbaK/EbsC family protein [Candidatus Limnocylindria bacterium]
MSAAEAAQQLSESARRVQDAIANRGFPYRVFELLVPVRTAADAAREVGCTVGQIAKSLVFRAERSGRPVLVITSGANRVNEARIAEQLGEGVLRADPGFVREQTGFAIGGIPPLGHAHPLVTYVDQDLLAFGDVWAAAGHPNALFRLDPHDLPRLSGGQVVQVA